MESTICWSLKMHHESELTRQKTEEDLAQPEDDVSTGSETTTVDQRSIDNVAIVNFQPGEPADPHNWSMVRSNLSQNTVWRAANNHQTQAKKTYVVIVGSLLSIVGTTLCRTVPKEEPHLGL